MPTITITIETTDLDAARNALREALHGFTEDIGADASVAETVVTATADGGELLWNTTTVSEPEAKHEPSGLPMILAHNLPEELLQVEGATDLLNIISSGYDMGDSWASAMSAGFALCEALYVLEADIPSELQYRPGAWDGTFSVDDIRTGGNGGDHELTVELLQYMDQDTDTAVDQLTRLALAVDGLIDRLRAEGKDY